MFKAKFLIAVSVAASTAIPVIARADSPRCQLLTYKPTQVAPLYVTFNAARGGTTRQLTGAQVFVPAQPGLTPEWLRLDLERHISAMKAQGMPGCPLAGSGVTLSIVSGGTGYWVQIGTKNSDAAKAIFGEAQHLVQLPPR